MKQGKIKLEKKKEKKKLVAPETEICGIVASGLNLWSRSPSTTAMGFGNVGGQREKPQKDRYFGTLGT